MSWNDKDEDSDNAGKNLKRRAASTCTVGPNGDLFAHEELCGVLKLSVCERKFAVSTPKAPV